MGLGAIKGIVWSGPYPSFLEWEMLYRRMVWITFCGGLLFESLFCLKLGLMSHPNYSVLFNHPVKNGKMGGFWGVLVHQPPR